MLSIFLLPQSELADANIAQQGDFGDFCRQGPRGTVVEVAEEGAVDDDAQTLGGSNHLQVRGDPSGEWEPAHLALLALPLAAGCAVAHNDTLNGRENYFK